MNQNISMRNRLNILGLTMLIPFVAMAQSEMTDSIKAQELKEVVVEGQLL